VPREPRCAGKALQDGVALAGAHLIERVAEVGAEVLVRKEIDS